MMRGKSVILVTEVLLLAMLACGTAYGELWIGDHWPTVAYDPLAQNYLTVYQTYGQPFPTTRLINAWGTTREIGDILYPWWSDEYSRPSIALDTANGKFFMAWTGDWPFNDLYGQLLPAESYDHPLLISNAPGAQTDALVTFDTVNERFLVTWLDYRAGDHPALYGQLVDSTGALQGTEFVIDGELFSYSVAYDHVNQRYLVVSGPPQVSGQFINADGTLRGGKFSIVERPEPYPVMRTSVAYDGLNQRYLVVWDEWWGGGQILGQIVNADGTLQGTHSVISGYNEGKTPTVAFDHLHQRFLVAWGSTWIYGRFVNADGTPQGKKIIISRKGQRAHDHPPIIAFNPQCGNFLVAGLAINRFPSPDVYAEQSSINFNVIGDPCPQALLTVKKKGAGNKDGQITAPDLKCSGNDCQGKYIRGTAVAISVMGGAVAAWAGCDAVTDNVCSVTMNTKKAVTVTFSKPPGRISAGSEDAPAEP